MVRGQQQQRQEGEGLCFRLHWGLTCTGVSQSIKAMIFLYYIRLGRYALFSIQFSDDFLGPLDLNDDFLGQLDLNCDSD